MPEEKKSSLKLILGVVAAVVIVGAIAATTIYFVTKNKSDSKDSKNSSASSKTAGMNPEADFADNIKNDPNLSSFVSAVDAAGLTETLRGGPYTLLAPNNDAFTRLTGKSLEELNKPENKKELTDILTYHVIPGAFELSDFKDGDEITTFNGAKIKVKKDDSGYMLNEAKVVTSNITQKNGVLQIIDKVLIPAGSGTKLSKVGGVDLSSDKTFLENLGVAPTLTNVAAAVEASGLGSTLNTDGPFTIFVPSNSAFSKLPSGTIENLLKPENKNQLIGVLTYHVVPGKILASELKDGQEITTVGGAKLKVKIVGTKISLIGGKSTNIATVETSDVLQKNGVAHIVDAVLFPPST